MVTKSLGVPSMNKKYIISIAVVLIVIIVGLVWRRISTDTHGAPIDKVTLQLKWLHQAQFAGFYAAAQRGFYKAEGLDVTILPVGSDLSEKKVIERVDQGAVQFGIVGGDQVLLARENNKAVRAVAVIFQHSPVVFAALKSTGIKNLKDIIGKRMGIEKGQNTESIYRSMMKKAGIDTSEIKEITSSPGLGVLVGGIIDARMIYLINEGLEAKEKDYPINIIYPEDYGVQTYADTLITSDALIKQNPDLVQRFVRASLKGWSWSVTNPEEAGKLSQLYNPRLDISHEINMMQMSLPFIYTGGSSIGAMDAKSWNSMENIFFEGGLLKARVPLESVFTTQFLQP